MNAWKARVRMSCVGYGIGWTNLNCRIYYGYLAPPGAGKSAIATTLSKQFSGKRVCVKIVAKRDFVDRRDPRSVWRTLAYNLAGLHAGVKGSIMEALSETSHYSQDEFRDLIVNALQDQQSLSVFFVIDALDEYFTENNDSGDWRSLLRTVAGWANLPRSIRFVVTSRDIPDIRNTLAKVSYSISLTTGKEASIEAKSDTHLFFQRKFAEMPKDVNSSWPSEEVIDKLTEYAAGSFIWAKMAVELVGKLGPQAVDRVEDILGGVELGSIELVYNLYAKMLSDVLAQLDEKERSASRLILAAIVLAKDPPPDERRSQTAVFIQFICGRGTAIGHGGECGRPIKLHNLCGRQSATSNPSQVVLRLLPRP